MTGKSRFLFLKGFSMPVKILLADKSITIQKVVEMLFSGRDYEVTCASDGETALSEAARVIPDVVLADVDLPRVDGYAFSTRLKQTPLLAQTPVILMMSRDDVYDSSKGKQAGIIDNIAKPFESQELIGKVKKALVATASNVIESGIPAAVPKAARPVAGLSEIARGAVDLTQQSSTDIFDILQEAPTESEIKKAAAPGPFGEESVYEVEPEVEEVEEPLARETAKTLPVGDDAVEEMRASLGLTDQTEEVGAEINPFESLEITRETASGKSSTIPMSAASHPEGLPGMAAISSTLPSEELRQIAEETIAKMARDMFAQMPRVQPPTLPESELRKMAESAISEMAKEAITKVPPPQPPALSASELWGIAEETIAKMAKDMFAQMPSVQPPTLPESELRQMAADAMSRMAKEAFAKIPPPQPPVISTDELRSIAEKTISKMAKDLFAQMPLVQPPKISEDKVLSAIQDVAEKLVKEALEKAPPRITDTIVRELVEEKVVKIVNETMGKMTIPEPPVLPESELRKMAETTVTRMAEDIFKNMPPPPMPKISDEAVRRGLESVLSQIARETAKEVIEQVAWEAVPHLAEHLIKEEIERLKAET
jgi:DNA-binding response OmpR family regulator